MYGDSIDFAELKERVAEKQELERKIAKARDALKDLELDAEPLET